MKHKIKTGIPLNVLFLEDNPKDAELCRELIIDSGYNLNMDITATEKEFESFIRTRKYDIILSDFNLEGFDAFGALRLYNKICPDVPFICVSGTIGEETAVELLKLGAVDYLLKDRLERLPFAIKKAIEDGINKESRRKAEKLLAASEVQYRRLFESAKDGILILNSETGKIVDVNPFMIELLGYSKEEFLEKEIWEIGFFKNIVANKDKFIELLHKEYVRYEDLPLETSNGRQIDVEFVSNVYPVNSHKVIQCNIRNITERRQAEDALRKSEVEFRTVWENSASGMRITDENGIVVKVNNAFCKMFGKAKEELEGKPFSVIYTKEKEKYILLKHQELYSLKTVEPYVVKELKLWNGKIIWVQVTNSFLEIEGEKTLLLGIFTDISERKRAEESLKESEERFRHSFDYAAIGVCIVGTDKKFQKTNKAFREMIGYEEMELKDYTFSDITHPDDLSIGFSQKQLMLEGEIESTSFEKRYIRKDKQIIWAHVSSSLVRNANHQPQFFITQIMDITERKQAEEVSKQEQALTNAIIDAIPGTFYMLNEIGQYVRWNAYQRDEIIGKPDDLIGSTNALETIYPDDRELIQSKIVNVLANDVDETIEGRVLLRGGPAFRWLLMTGRRMLIDNHPFLIGIGVDITERKRAEEALLKLKKAVDNSGEIIFLTDKEGLFTFVNPAFTSIYGFTADEIVGKATPRILKSGEEDSNYYKLFWETLKDGKEKRGELINKRKDGTLINVEVSASPIFDETKNIIGFLGIQRDITKRKQAEAALRAASSYNRRLIESSIDPLVTIGPDGKITDVNKATEIVTGISREVLVGDDFSNYFTEPIKAKEGYEKVLGEGFVKDYPLTIRHTLGKTTDVLYNATVYKNEKGDIQGVFAAARDITELKHANEELKASEKRYRDTLDNMLEGCMLIGFDWRYLYINEAAARHGFQKRENLIGKTMIEMYPGVEKSELFAGYKHCMEERKSLQFESSFTFSDGKVNWYFLSVQPVPEGIFVLSLDISKRKRAEEEIAMLAHSLRSVNECVSITDMEDNILFVNESFLKTYGYSENELLGENMIIARSPNNPTELTREILPATISGGWKGELWNKRKDGSEFPISLSTTVINDKDGKPLGLIGVAQDITERKRAEKELIGAKEKAEEMNRLKTNFIHNMSHELRTPLNGILGFAEILISELTEPDQNEMAQDIFTSGKRLSETLNFILDLSEAETNKVELTSKNIAVVPLTINCINSFTKVAAKKHLLLEIIIKDENIYAYLEEHLFSRILYNLLDNALKFTRQGKISVKIGKEVSEEKDWLYIKVKDSGIGIAEDKIDIIWDEFRQASEGLNRSYEGAGLGLTITKRAVELMRGKISVESELGVGSTFTVKFPSVKVIPSDEKVIQTKQVEADPLMKENADKKSLPLALYVEDDYSNRNVVKLYLKNTCIVETVEDGEIALQLVAEKKFDLILMDIGLPGGINGMEVVREILKMPEYANTPIIAVTAYAKEEDKTEFLNGGCTHYISKPFDKQELVNLITSLFNQQ